MYNAEQKQSFLDSINGNYGSVHIKEYIGIFNKIEIYEKENKCDVSQFTFEQLMDMYDKLKLKYSTQLKYNGKLNIYSNEIGKSNLDFLKVKDWLSIKIKEEKQQNKEQQANNAKTLSYAKVKDLISRLKNPADKFLVLGAFSGITGKNYIELSHSSMEDCDEKTGLIWLAGYDDNGDVVLKKRKFYASPELFEIAIDASKSEIYFTERNNKSMVKNTISEGKRIIKLTRKTNNNLDNAYRSTILDRCSNLSRKYNLDILTPSTLYWSGVIYQIGKLAVENGEINITARKAIKMPGFEEIRKQYDFQIEDRSLINKLEWYLE